MINLFKEVCKLLLNYFTNKELHEWYKLTYSYRKFTRYQEATITIMKNKIITPDVPSVLWQYKEIFIDRIYKFQQLSNTPLIIDVGANIGMSIIYFAKNYPNAKIIGIEADHNIFGYLEKNLNNFRVSNCQIINTAAWVNDQGIYFSADGADGGSIYGSKKSNKTNSIRLSDLLKEHRYIDMLKIDIEGAEYEVILDCDKELSKVKNLFIEYHSWTKLSQKLSEILLVLEKNNFRYYLETINKKSQPFCQLKTTNNMDLQINIYAINQNL